jgi:gibberellin 2-oxidase
VTQEVANAMSKLANTLARVLAESLGHAAGEQFPTVLCQDHVGGLQLMKGSRWVAVKPTPNALIVNIGDLFQVHPHTSSIIEIALHLLPS